MGFLKNLKEGLDAQKTWDGIMNEKYETRFKVEGQTFAFIAESIAGNNEDDTCWYLWFENIDTHRLTEADNDKKVIKAFVEAVNEWVKAKQPYSFKYNGSHFEVFDKITEGIKKKVKKYNLIDLTKEIKDESGHIIEANPVGMITWTKMIPEEAVPSEDIANAKQDKFEQTFEDVDEIKTQKGYDSGTSKTDKLDKGKEQGYEVKLDWQTFKDKKLNESK